MKKTHNLKPALILTILLTLLVSSFAQAVLISPGLVFKAGNITYGVSTPINFDNITLGSTWINLNGLGLNFSSIRASWFNFSYYRSHPHTTSTGQMIMNFSTNTTNRWVTFNISGLKNSYSYMVLNGTILQQFTSSASGQLQWKHNLIRTFQYP